MRRIAMILLVLSPLALGCGDEAKSPSPAIGNAVAPSAPDEVLVLHQDKKPAAEAGGGAGPAGPPKPDPAVKRRIIYNAGVDLVVNDFEDAKKQVARLIDDSGGYVAKSDLGAQSGEHRRASWTLRVPVANYQSILDSLARMGHALTVRTDSQDITDEFFDLEARLKNKRTEEERLLEHLKKSTGKLEDILAVERELTRVRGEIESAQGRLNKMSKLSELTTITVTIREQKDYTPPTAPTYTTTLGRAFGDSVNALTTFLKWIVIVIVTIAPWLPLLAVAAVVPWWLIRRSSRVRIAPRTTLPSGQTP